MRRGVALAWWVAVAFLLADLSAAGLQGLLHTPPPVAPVARATTAPRAMADPAPTLTVVAAAVDPSSASPAAQEPQVVLRGTLLGSGASVAFLLEGTELRCVTVGDLVQGWKLTSVEAERARFELDGRVFVAALNAPAPAVETPKTPRRDGITRPGDLRELVRGAELKAVERGILLARLDPNAPLASYGLRQGDLIMEINGQDVRTFDDISRLADVLNGADDFEVVVERQGQTLPVRFSLRR